MRTVAIFFIVDLGTTFNIEFVGSQQQITALVRIVIKKTNPPSSSQRGGHFSKHVNILQRIEVNPRMTVMGNTSSKLQHCTAGEGQQQFTTLLCLYRKLLPDAICSTQSQSSCDSLVYIPVHVR
jgi:hypothetical protein